MYDFLMIGWEVNYSRNRVLLHDSQLKFKTIEIKKDNFIVRQIKLFFLTLWALLWYKTNAVFLPAFNQPNAPIVVLLAKMFRKKIVIDVLVSEYDTIVNDRKTASSTSFRGRRARFYDDVTFKYADVLICDTEHHKAFFVDFFNAPIDKCVVIPVGAEASFFSKTVTKHKQTNDKKKILFYGGFSPLHGIDTILKAAQYLPSKEYEVTLIGEGQVKGEMVMLAEKLAVENVKFVGRVPYDRLPQIIQEADIGLGIFGGTEKANRVIPNKVFQMAACGKAIITLETNGIKELFTNGENAVLIPTSDNQAELLAQKIISLGNESDKLYEMGNNAKRLIEERCSPHMIRNQFKQVIQ